jgi:uncharacterized membrane protein YcfT
MSGTRINWVDYAKGLCIIAFVMAQSVSGYAGMTGLSNWMEFAAAWTTPIVLPTLFVLSGLFLPRTLFGSKSTFFDRKVLRFVYFYLVWLLIQTVILYALDLAWNPLHVVNQLLIGLIQPTTGLWIIPILALFHLATWLTRLASPVKILLAAALAQTIHAAGLFHTGWLVPDAFAQYFVFFFAGYHGAGLFRRFADRLSDGFSDVPIALVIWAAINTVLVAQETATLPIISLVLGFAGVFAIIGLSTLLANSRHGMAIRYIGRAQFVIYLTYFLPMMTAQLLLARSGLMPEPGLTSVAIGLIAIILPLGFHRLVRQTPLKALYRRPRTFRLKDAEPSRGGQLLGSAHDTVEEA